MNQRCLAPEKYSFMIALICVLLSPLVMSEISDCKFGGEECLCEYDLIRCLSPQSEQSDLPVEFSQLPLDALYIVDYQNKNMKRIRKNSSLSRQGLRLEKLILSDNNIEIIEQEAFAYTYVEKMILSSNDLKSLEFLIDSLYELKELDLSNNQLEILKSEWFEGKTELEVLDMRFNSLVSIEGGVFCNLPKLDSFSLEDNKQLETIESGAFCEIVFDTLDLSQKRLANLDFLIGSLCLIQTLNLENNSVEYLRKQWFECKSRLSTLKLNHNRLTSVEGSVFTELTMLSILELKYNQIHTIESSAFTYLDSLITFDISDNLIKEIRPYAFNNLTSLESITSLTNQFIQVINPYSFVGLTALKQLSFEANILTSLSGEIFVGLDSLTELNFRDNYLLTIESGVFDDVPNLEYLYLSLNDLNKIDQGYFSSLKRLTNLMLDQNRIEVIEPYSFVSQRESLKSLNISYNKLGQVKKSHFSDLRVLLVLDLSNNQISSIEQGSFENAISLVELRLDHNCIYNVHQDLFKYLDQLQSLSMSNNVLIKLDSSVFRHNLSRLINLNLRLNQIGSLPDFIFKNLKNLNTLDLSNNRLKSLSSPQVFQGLGSLKYLYLSNNFIESITIQPIQRTLVSLRLESNWLDEFELDEEITYLSVINLSSNRKLNNAGRLMSSLEKCQTCEFEFKFRNMSTHFIYDFVLYLSKFPPLVSKILSLDLSYNDLSLLFDLIPFSSMSSSLTELYLKNTNINCSISFLDDLASLKVLDLSEHQITLNPKYFFERPFTALYLSNMGIRNIKNELNLANIYYLEELDLSRNLIEIIEDNIIDLKKVNLSYNRIFSIEEISFHGLWLDLSHNLFKSFKIYNEKDTDLFMDNNMLQYFINGEKKFVLGDLNLDENRLDYIDFASALSLSMKRNNLTSIKRTDSSVCNLRELICSSNQIVVIENESFYYCKDLQKLDLSNNLIKSVTNHTFVGLVSLEYLNLSSNLIELIQRGVFDQSNLLTSLDLNSNKIKCIMDKSFSSLIYLEILYLDSLQMETLSNLTFDGLESVKFLKLNSIQFDLVQNIETVKKLSKEYKSKNERFTWYPSTSIEFNVTVFDARYCSMVIYFARNNILINLLADLDQSNFLSNCRSFTLIDLKYSKYGFE